MDILTFSKVLFAVFGSKLDEEIEIALTLVRSI